MPFISPPIWGSTLEPQIGPAQLCSPLALRLLTKIYSTDGCTVSSSKAQHFLLQPRQLWQDEVARSLRLCHSANTQPSLHRAPQGHTAPLNQGLVEGQPLVQTGSGVRVQEGTLQPADWLQQSVFIAWEREAGGQLLSQAHPYCLQWESTLAASIGTAANISGKETRAIKYKIKKKASEKGHGIFFLLEFFKSYRPF